MAKPQKPKAAYTANGWYLELPGLVSPRFETLTGLTRSTGNIQVVDAGTNIKYNFASQIMDFGTINLTRNLDGSVDDKALDVFVTACMTSGLKAAGLLIKLHFGRPVFTIGFEGLKIQSDAFSDFNIESEDKLIQTFVATVDTWLKT